MCRVIPQRYSGCSCPTFRTGLCGLGAAVANAQITENFGRRHAERHIALECHFYFPNHGVVEIPGLCRRHLREAIQARWAVFSHFLADFHRADVEGKSETTRRIYNEQMRNWETLYREIVDYETNLRSNPDPDAADFRRWLGLIINQFNEKIDWMRGLL